MSEPIRGQGGAGATTVYTVPRDQSMRLELLTFTMVTDGTIGVHAPVVIFTDASVGQATARLWDWNEGGPSMTLEYTYGIGLRPFNCTVTTGMMIQHDLPETILAPETAISVTPVNAAGVTIAGDTISGVVLYGELIPLAEIAAPVTVQLVAGLLPGSVAA